MQIIPVIDLLGGQVIRGIGGRRSEYRPIESHLVPGSDPGKIAAAFVEHFGATTCYVADLDAIQDGSVGLPNYVEIARAGVRLWLDAGFVSLVRLAHVWESCRERGVDADYVVGLESLFKEDALSLMVTHFPQPIVFSMDLREGQPLTRIDKWRSLAPQQIADTIIDTGITRMIVLDLADVGTGGGTRTLDLCRELKAKHPQIELIAGGGVRNLDDLKRISDAGCSGALVASALHDGRLRRADLAAAAKL